MSDTPFGPQSLSLFEQRLVVARSRNNRVTGWEFDKKPDPKDSVETTDMAVAGVIRCA